MKYRDIVANKQTFVQLLRCINASMDFALNSRLNVRFILVLFRYSVNKQISNEKITMNSKIIFGIVGLIVVVAMSITVECRASATQSSSEYDSGSVESGSGESGTYESESVESGGDDGGSGDGRICITLVVCDTDGNQYSSPCAFEDAQLEDPGLQEAPCSGDGSDQPLDQLEKFK